MFSLRPGSGQEGLKKGKPFLKQPLRATASVLSNSEDLQSDFHADQVVSLFFKTDWVNFTKSRKNP